jgi:hypothetical protein
MATQAIMTTKNYRMFCVSEENRPLDLSRRKALRDSMKSYGFLKSFPLSCYRDRNKKLVVKDGQNRLGIAEELGLPVHYFIEDVDYDIATVNNAQQKWTLNDYAMKWAAQGKEHYATLLAFIELHSMPIGLGTSLLCGYSHLNGCLMKKFKDGGFEVLDYEFADRVAAVYLQLVRVAKEIKSRNCLAAVIAAMRVPGFDCKRLVDGAKKRPEKLKPYATRDSYLEMIEDIYNFNRTKLIAVKMPALQILRERDAAPDSH